MSDSGPQAKPPETAIEIHLEGEWLDITPDVMFTDILRDWFPHRRPRP